MAIQVYECPYHGEWEHQQPMTASVAPVLACRVVVRERTTLHYCGKSSKHVLKPPHVRVDGGTTPPR